MQFWCSNSHVLCFVIKKSVVFNLLCVWILFYNFVIHKFRHFDDVLNVRLSS